MHQKNWHQKKLASICLVLLAVASVAVAESGPELRTERSITLPREGADWPMWSGPEGNLTSLGNGVFDGGAFGLERLWSRPLGSAYSGVLVVDGRLVTTFSDGTSDFLVALDASGGAEQWRYGGAGFSAMYLALHHPGTVSRAAAQSYEHGALEEDLMAAASGEKHDLELVFHWSSHDRFYPFWDFDARRDAKSMVAALEKNGYRPKVIESDDGVGWGMWQGRMAEILEALFPLQ